MSYFEGRDQLARPVTGSDNAKERAGPKAIKIYQREEADQLQSLVFAQQGDTEHALAVVSALDLSPFDNHITFHFAEVLSKCGETARALDVLESSVNKGFCTTPFIEVHCRFLESLRSHARIAPIVATARAVSDEIRRDVTAAPV